MVFGYGPSCGEALVIHPKVNPMLDDDSITILLNRDVKTQAFTLIRFFLILLLLKPCKPEIQKLLCTFVIIFRKIISFFRSV